MVVIAVGGVADHVQLLLSLPSTVPIAKAVQLLKSGSSEWIHENFPQSRGFSWQQGYGPFRSAIIQPSLTGLVHALFATQHCVLGYYQAVPAGLHATNSCRSSRAGKECTSYRTAVGAILP